MRRPDTLVPSPPGTQAVPVGPIAHPRPRCRAPAQVEILALAVFLLVPAASARGGEAAGPDTSMLSGSGLNTLGHPISRVDPVGGGMLVKDPGSRLWRPLAPVTDAQREAERRRRSAERLRLHGDDPYDIAAVLPDSASIRVLLELGVPITGAPPCTVFTRVKLRDAILRLRRAGIRFYERSHWPPARRDSARNRPRPQPAAPVPRSGLGPATTTSTLVFSEGFESNPIPGTVWSAADYNSNSGYDYWGNVDAACGLIHSGSWSADAAGWSDTPCRNYDNNQTADLQNISGIDLSQWPSFTVSFWVSYSTEGGYDFLYFQAGGSPNPTTALITMTGSSGGWVQKQMTFDNLNHAYDSFYLRFVFASDNIITASGGVYVDDIEIRGDEPNLTAYMPSGWSGPIVPSSVLGTTTTGTLYAGQPTYIDWALRNVDAGGAGAFYVDYYLDNSWIGNDYISSLAANTTYTRTDWSYTVGTRGPHTLKMEIDPGVGGGLVQESNESDNVYQATFTWLAPDLVITGMDATVLAPNPAPRATAVSAPEAPALTFTMGETIEIAVTVQNQGNLGAGTFRVDWYRNRGSPPTVYTYGDLWVSVPGLAAGASAVVHFQATGTKKETWNMYAFADAGGQVAEAGAEGNNAYGPLSVTWTPQSIYVTGTFLYDDSLLGQNQTTACNTVWVYDRDSTGVDDSLATAAAQWATGRFVIGPIVNEDADDDHGFLDLYVKVYPQSNEACWNASYPSNVFLTVIDVSGQRWHVDSGVFGNWNADTLDVGILKPTDYGNRWALHLYNVALKGWAYVRNNVVAPPDSVTGVFVQWEPSFAPTRGTGYVPAFKRIQVSGSIDITTTGYDPDEWDDDVLLHEYGHHVAFWAGFGTDVFPADDNLDHFLDQINPSLNTAWLEGWAHYFVAATRPTPEARLVNTGRTSTGLYRRRDFFLEGDSIVYYKPAPVPEWTPADTDTIIHVNENGPQWEASVAGALWDIYDSRHDNPNGDAFADSLSDGFPNLYNALHQGSPPGSDRVVDIHSAHFYYDSLAAHPRVDIRKFGLSQRVFWEHGITDGPVLTGAEGLSAAPEAYPRIVVAYPNPFNPLVRIVFNVPAGPAGAPASLRVYDVQGRLVRTLATGPLKMGRHEAIWDGKADDGAKAGSGIYLCRLESGRRSASAKLTLLR